MSQLEQVTRKLPDLLFPLVAQYCIYSYVMVSKKESEITRRVLANVDTNFGTDSMD
jgi:hypothetical protein